MKLTLVSVYACGRLWSGFVYTDGKVSREQLYGICPPLRQAGIIFAVA